LHTTSPAPYRAVVVGMEFPRLKPGLVCPTWVQTNQMKGIDRKQ
jgi:hypothetical protein